MTRPLMLLGLGLMIALLQPTPPLVAGESFRVLFEHTAEYYQLNGSTWEPCSVPSTTCLPDTQSYQLKIDGAVVQTLPFSEPPPVFIVANGTTAGTHTIIVEAVGSSVTPSAGVNLSVQAAMQAPGPQGAPVITQGAPPPPPATWTEITTLRGTRVAPANSDSSTLAYPGTVAAGTRLVIAGAAWAASPATSVAVTGSGTGCTGLTFAVRFNAAVPTGMQWRTFIAQALTTTAGPCTISVNPSGIQADFSWTQTGFTGPATVTETLAACQGTSTAPQCSLAGLAGMLVVGVMSHDGATMALTAGSGVTAIGENETNAAAQAHAAARTIRTADGTALVNWTMGSTAPWGVQLVGWR